MSSAVTKSITEQNTFSDTITPKKELRPGIAGAGFLNISIAGTFTATVTLQRRFGDSDSWRAVKTWTAVAETYIFDYEEGVEYRIGVLTGDWTSDQCDVRLGR